MRFPLSVLDWIALVWFFVWWVGYVAFAHWYARRRPSLVGVMTAQRRQWMTSVMDRENRIGDVSILTNLSNGATFFASTTLLILGGLLALLGTTDKLASVVTDLPFARQSSEQVWEIKVLLLTGIFMFAFFKFTWALRLYHFCSVLVGSALPVGERGPATDAFIGRATRTATQGAESFNNGLRAYYFALAATIWVINPWMWMIATSWTVLILYHREFHSDALQALT